MIFVKKFWVMLKKCKGGGLSRLKFLEMTDGIIARKNLKITFLTDAPFIVKFRFEKYRYLLTYLLCIQIFEAPLSDSHSTREGGERYHLPELFPKWFCPSYMIKTTRWSNQNTFIWLKIRFTETTWLVQLKTRTGLLRTHCSPSWKLDSFLGKISNASELTVQYIEESLYGVL